MVFWTRLHGFVYALLTITLFMLETIESQSEVVK